MTVGARWQTLFNQPEFHALNLREEQTVLEAHANDNEGRLIGIFGAVRDADGLVNGYSAPFGGVDFARPRETAVNVAALVDEALAQFRNTGVSQLRVKLPPACYGENEQLVQFTLLNRGFSVERCELNQHIDLTGLATAEAYVQRLKSPARRALQWPAGQDLTFAEAHEPADWDRAYDTLAANRAARGRRLSLSRDYVERARLALGERVRMFELVSEDRSVAAALIYRVKEHKELVVAWGDGVHKLEHSPMNVLAYRVVERALADHVSTLDLGISNENQPGPDGWLVANGGLVQFKQSVLGQIEPRLTLVRDLTR